jgi:diguanylate cyclase (GGDEF)-like protein
MKTENNAIERLVATGISTRSTLDEALRVASVRNMADQEKSALVAGLFGVVAIALAALFLDHGIWLAPVLALRLLCMAFTYTVCLNLLALLDAGQPVAKELKRFERAMIINGLSWGIVLWPIGGEFFIGMPALIITLTTLMSMSLLVVAIAIERRSMFCAIGAFAVTSLAPMILSIQTQGLLPLVGGAGFAIAIAIYGGRHGGNVRSWLRVRIENQQLAETLGETNARLTEALSTAERLAEEDSLTGLLNRRAFEKHAGNLLLKTGRDRNVYLLLADLDRFKAINDNFGHAIGDVVLELTSEVIMQTSGKEAICARWGGEEFLIALPAPDREAADQIMQRLMTGIKTVSPRLGIEGIKVSASFGLSHWRLDEDMDSAIARADKRMYLVKGDRRQEQRMAG